MLIPRTVQEASRQRHGGRCSIAELRRRMAVPGSLDEGHRQRLQELATRLARVRCLGDEFSRVDLSEHVHAALGPGAVSV